MIAKTKTALRLAQRNSLLSHEVEKHMLQIVPDLDMRDAVRAIGRARA
jgi:hypothetical protein